MGWTKKWLTPPLKQAWVVSGILMNTIGLGMILGFPSCLLPALDAPESTIKITMDESSWLVSCLPIASMSGYIPSTLLISKTGRRTAYIYNTLPILVGIIVTAFATNFISLLIGRVLVGLAAGSATTIGVIVIGEYTSPEYRGMFLNMKTGCISLGILVVHVLGEYLPWQNVAMCCLVPFIGSLAVCYTWPDSPSWLAEKKKFKESEMAFYWLRGKSEDSTREIEELIQQQKKNNEPISELSFFEKVVVFLGKFKKRNFVKPTIVFAFASIIIETSGRHIFPSYAAQLLKEMVTENLNPFHYNVAIDIIITVSSFVASYLVTLVNLRKLLFVSGLLSLTILNITCLLLYLTFNGMIAKQYSWIAVSCFTIFFLFSNLGCSCLPIALMGEIFPLEHRAVGSSVAGAIISVAMIITLKVMPYLVDRLQIYGALEILAITMGVALTVLYFIMPETRNRTLLEIEYFFTYGKYRDGDIISGDELNEKHGDEKMLHKV